MTHTNGSWWHRGHRVFRKGLNFPLKWTLDSFSSVLDIHRQRKPAYDSAHVLTAKKSPEVGHHPRFHPLRSAVLASEPPKYEPAQRQSGCLPNSLRERRWHTLRVVVSINNHQLLWWFTPHGVSMCKHSEAGDLLSVPSHQRRETDRNSFWWCQMLWAVVHIRMNLWGITDLWATALSEESKRGREVGIISCCFLERNSAGTPDNKKLETILEWVYLPTFLSINVCIR